MHPVTERIVVSSSIFFILFTINLSAGEWSLLGFSDEQIRSVAVHPKNPDIIFVGGNYLYKTIEGGWMWDTVALYPANSIVFHPLNPDTMYFTYGEGSWSDGVYRSIDGGDTWEVIHWMMYAKSLVIPSWPDGILVAGSKGGGVERSDDGGITWYEMNDSLGDLNILSLATVSPFDSIPSFLAGTESGIYIYPSKYWIKTASPSITAPAIEVYREYLPILWAALDGGTRSDGVYKSTDYGLSWEVSRYLLFIRDVLVNPLDSQTVYAADSGLGVAMTKNGGVDWCFINENLGDSVVFCLAQSPADTHHLYAGTQHGLYVYNLGPGVQEDESSPNTCFVFQNKPNPFRERTLIKYGFPDRSHVSITVHSLLGQEVRILVNAEQDGGIHTVTWDATDSSSREVPSGIYFLKLQILGRRGSREYTITKKLSVIR